MDLLTQAREYLSRDPLRYVDMLEPVRRGMVEVTALREDGVLLYNVPGELYMLAAGQPGFLPGPLRRGGFHGAGGCPQPGDGRVFAAAVRDQALPGLHPGGLFGPGAACSVRRGGDPPFGAGIFFGGV